MAYPPPTYQGDTGELSATLRPAPVLLGTLRIHDGRSWVEAEAGDFVHVPIGGIHGFRYESGAPASLLIHFAPGAPREGYFEGLARWEVEGRPDDAVVEAFFRLHDNHWV